MRHQRVEKVHTEVGRTCGRGSQAGRIAGPVAGQAGAGGLARDPAPPSPPHPHPQNAPTPLSPPPLRCDFPGEVVLASGREKRVSVGARVEGGGCWGAGKIDARGWGRGARAIVLLAALAGWVMAVNVMRWIGQRIEWARGS